MASIVFTVCAYLLGSISFAVVSSRLFGLPDPRTFGSGNPGATNVLRTGRKAAALVTLIGDSMKGWLAVWLALRLAPEYGLGSGTVAAVAAAAFLGHLYPVFFGFRGGKGVATAAGILIALDVWVGLSTLGVWLLVAGITRVSSLAALVAAGFAPLFAWYFFGAGWYALAVLLISALLVWRHRSNIRKLLSGTESKISKGAASPPGSA